MRAPATVVLLLSIAVVPQAQSAAPCGSSAECAQMVEAAIAREAFEEAHDLAWRAAQLGRRNDPALMYLLARAQALSGRPTDALVMLRRLAGMNVRPADVETSDDLRRVRALAEWEAVREAMAGASGEGGERGGTKVPPSVPASAVPPVSPSAVPSVPPSADLAVPAAVIAPTALAYDAVSRRFVLADESSDTLKIVDELTGNVVNLVSRGWSNGYRPTAIAIDTRRGDLWASGVQDGANGEAQSALLKLQLISGRLLQTLPLPDDAGAVRIVDVGVGRNTVWALDAAGRRLFAIAAGGVPRAQPIALSADPTSLAVASDTAIYVAHRGGIDRVDIAARKSAPVAAAKGVSLADLQSLAWHSGGLFGVQRRADGTHAAVQLRLDARGRTVTAIDTVEPAATRAAAIYGGMFFWVGLAPDGSLTLRRIPTR
jgi:hypothetical protein